MANQTDIELGEVSVRVSNDGSSPVLDVVGGNNWNLEDTDGDVRIGDDNNSMQIGVSLGGAGAGTGRIWATNLLKLGSGGNTNVAEIRPDRIEVNSSQTIDGSIHASGSITTLGDFLKVEDGDVICLGGLIAAGELLANDVISNLVPDGTYSLGSSSDRWDTLYVNSVSKSSDRRLKTDISNIQDGLRKLLELQPVTYSFNDNGAETHFGLIGQDVKEIIPDIVDGQSSGDSFLGIDYMELVPLLIDSIQKQQNQIEQLERRLDQQSDEIETQESRINELERRLMDLEAA